MTTTRKLFLDCDGVLADFDEGATRVFGMSPKAFQARRGPGPFWARLASTPDFYATLPLLPGALELFEAVRHLDPIILTGLPRGKWAEPQKRAWAAQHFPATTMITCMARDKRDHCTPGDVLVDDQEKYAELWQGAGGVFILHKHVETTLQALAEYFPLARE